MVILFTKYCHFIVLYVFYFLTTLVMQYLPARITAYCYIQYVYFMQFPRLIFPDPECVCVCVCVYETPVSVVCLERNEIFHKIPHLHQNNLQFNIQFTITTAFNYIMLYNGISLQMCPANVNFPQKFFKGLGHLL